MRMSGHCRKRVGTQKGLIELLQGREVFHDVVAENRENPDQLTGKVTIAAPPPNHNAAHRFWYLGKW